MQFPPWENVAHGIKNNIDGPARNFLYRGHGETDDLRSFCGALRDCRHHSGANRSVESPQPQFQRIHYFIHRDSMLGWSGLLVTSARRSARIRSEEVTLRVSPINDTLFGENKESDVDDFVNNENLGNHGDVSLAPEGSTWSMLLLGCGLLVAMMRFRKPRHS
jgi:hypothetical protein